MYASTHHLPVEQQLAIAIRLFTRVRWIPPLAILGGGVFFKEVLGLNLSIEALAQIAVWIIAYNVYLMRRQICSTGAAVPDLLRCANLHMFFDYFSITLLVYYTGGVLSPLVWFYSIHIIMSCIFFKRKKVLLWTGILWLALAALFLGEFFGWLPHQCVYGVSFDGLHRRPGFILAVLGGAALLWGSLIWLVTMIVERVRVAEQDERTLQVQYKQALDDLTESEKRRTLYRRVLTHELRSPVAAAQSLVRIMNTGAFGELPERQRGVIERVGNRLDQMELMVRDLLTMERIGREEFKLETVPLAPLLKEIVEMYLPQMEEHRLRQEISIDPQAVALADPEDLRTIFSNLISNAVKYNRDEGLIRIRAEARDGAIHLEIADTGIGIPKGDQKRLFEDFYRATNAKEHTVQGTGLGLSIVKSLVRQNNGLIELESVENQGTTIRLALPRATGSD
ncbi:MAG: HAMP domain-containing histidine kinase [Myxococcales bacterium]|nr:HAMP domain-containing histidine kinase [Myxococcales bacterium]